VSRTAWRVDVGSSPAGQYQSTPSMRASGSRCFARASAARRMPSHCGAAAASNPTSWPSEGAGNGAYLATITSTSASIAAARIGRRCVRLAHRIQADPPSRRATRNRPR